MPFSPKSLVILALGICLTGALEPALARKAPKPEPCPPARYLIGGGPIASDGSGTALEIGPTVALDGMCDPISAKRNQANRKGVTQVLARWKSCDGLTGAVVLQGKVLPGCSEFQGTLKAKKLKTKISATLSRCGDGIVDPSNGEQCDDGNALPGDGCEPGCVLPTPVTTTTAPAATTTSTVFSVPTTSTTFRGATTTSSTIRTTSTIVTGTTTTTTLPKTNLALVIVANPDPVAPGGQFTYELTVTNLGPVEAVQVQVRLPIPTGAGGCLSISEEGKLPNGCSVTQNIQWTVDRLPVGTSRTVQAVLTAAGNLASGDDHRRHRTSGRRRREPPGGRPDEPRRRQASATDPGVHGGGRSGPDR